MKRAPYITFALHAKFFLKLRSKLFTFFFIIPIVFVILRNTALAGQSFYLLSVVFECKNTTVPLMFRHFGT